LTGGSNTYLHLDKKRKRGKGGRARGPEQKVVKRDLVDRTERKKNTMRQKKGRLKSTYNRSASRGKLVIRKGCKGISVQN